MKRVIKSCVLFTALACLMVASVNLTFADDKEKAVALVKKTVAYYKANGLEKAIDEFIKPDGQFTDGDLYIFVYDLNGVMLAHPNKALMGRNMIALPDAKGKLFRKDIIDIAKTKGSGWVDYIYTNPKTFADESKTTYFERADDVVICCGIYNN